MNLNDLSNEQRELHRVAVCKALGLDSDPALGHLDYIWMPQENGMKNLVLYAKRGTTEVLRDINGIDVKSLDQHDGPGYVSFKATAINKKGRQEIAVGAHETEGLKGKKLADAIATAQTRALMRVTCQFATYGILSEAEVNVQVTNIATSESSLAQLSGSPVVMPPPIVAPSAAPGKDITAPVDIATHVAKVYEDGAKALADMKPDMVASNTVTTSVPAPVTGMNQSDIKADTPVVEEPRKKRAYRRRNQVNIASPGQQTEMPAGHIDVQGTITPVPETGTIVPISVPPATANDTEQGTSGNGLVRIPALAETKMEYHVPLPPHVGNNVVIVPDPVLKDVPIQVSVAVPIQANPAVPAQVNSAPIMDKVKQDEYKARLRKYSNDILPAAGMVPSESVGGTTMKLRKFSVLQVGVDATAFTEENFEDLFEFLDGYVAKNGAPALVQYINKALGVS